MAENKYGSVTKKGELHYEEPARLLFFGLPWTFRKFLVYDNDLVIRAGFFNLKEDDCYMYRITDVRLNRSLMQRIFGLSTITLYTSDSSDHTIDMKNIRRGVEIKDFIVENAERCRMMRRTVNMQNIGYEMGDDLQGD
ncbi:MAG: PH domain-containing protein [Lachnospiraceae bacterium]|nr:PH domain-containing protein [Lachnospiraceae bacterium]